MASESSVNGDFMPVDTLYTSSQSPRVWSFLPRNTPYLSPVPNDVQILVVGSTEANRIILSGDLSPTLQSAGLAGSRSRSFIRVYGVSENDPRVICINTLLRAREEMPVQPGVLNPNSIGKEFCQLYYEYFNTSREKLVCFYTDTSVLTFQGVKHLGVEPIVHLLGCLPQGWKPVVHDIDYRGTSDSVDVQVCGAMLTNSDWQLSGPAVELLSPLIESTQSYFSFCQSFHLEKNLEGKYYVVNEIFRLIK